MRSAAAKLPSSKVDDLRCLEILLLVFAQSLYFLFRDLFPVFETELLPVPHVTVTTMPLPEKCMSSVVQ